MDNTWNILSKDGKTVRATVHQLEYNGTYMGERVLNVTVQSATPIAWGIDDYIEYRGEKFSLDYIPSKYRQARTASRGDAIVYDSIKFKGVYKELEHCQFVDVVPADNHIPYTAMGAFTFYVEKVHSFAERVQANLDEAYGKGVWTVECDDNLGVNKDKPMSISVDTSVYNALAQFNNEFHIKFVVTPDRHIILGEQQKVTGHSFVYGKGNGLKKLTENFDDNQKIVTKAKCYGSTRNIPYMYYIHLQRSLRLTPKEVNAQTTLREIRVITDTPYNELYFKSFTKVGNVFSLTAIVNEVSFPIIVSKSDDTENAKIRVTFKEFGTRQVFSDPMNELLTQLRAGRFIFITKGVDFNNVPANYWYNPLGTPDNYSVHNLMLPGFPKESLDAWVQRNAKKEDELGKKLKEIIALGFTFSKDRYRPYILAPTYEKYGQRDGEKTFDQDDDEHEWWEIYPSMEEMTKTMLSSLAGYDLSSETAGTDGRVDKILTGSNIEDNGASSTGDFSQGAKDTKGQLINVSFKMRIPNVGFNLWDYRTTGEKPTLSMKSGMCAGRDFEIINCIPLSPITKGYELTLNRVLDNAIDRFFPYSDYNIKRGDKYVLTGIELPDEYVEAGSTRLFLQSIDWLADNCKEKNTYQPEIDNIWMVNNPDESSRLIEGMKFLFADTEMGISERAVTIAQLTIKEGQGGADKVSIPEYEVRLDDDQEATLMQTVEAKIKASNSDFSRSFSDIDKKLNNLDTRYLRKDTSDTTPYDLTIGGKLAVEKDVDVKGKVEGREFIEDNGSTFENLDIEGDTGEIEPSADPDAKIKQATWGKMKNVSGNVDNASRGNYALTVNRNGEYDIAPMQDVLKDMNIGSGGAVVCTMDEYEDMPSHSPNTFYKIEVRGVVHRIYLGDFLLGRKAKGDEEVSQGFPYTFPIIFA